MEHSDIWKNFKLGEELNVSGTFIYNGMRRFHEMKILDYEEDVFEVLYNLSVGFERLLKIAVVLSEHNDFTNQIELEKSLITHNHLELLKRIKRHAEVNLSTPHNDLLCLLSKFYKTLRYDRFTLSSAYDSKKEMEELCQLFSKHLNVEIQTDNSIFGLQNTDRFRQFFRRTILKISSTIYKIITDKARAINLYTFELRSASRAESIFLGEVNIADEDVLWKELLIFLMNTNEKSGYLEFLRQIDPLDFDPALIDDYLDCFRSNAAKAYVSDELDYLYSELKDNGERLKMMSFIAAPEINFESDEDEDEDEDEY